jgi:hypothetical protein
MTDYRMRRIRGHEFEENIPWLKVLNLSEPMNPRNHWKRRDLLRCEECRRLTTDLDDHDCTDPLDS